MDHTLRIAAVVVLAPSFSWSGVLAGEEAKRQPNVLFVVADDMSTDLGCYGHPLVETPHLDRLARRGVRFDRAYCQHPVCNPSRTSFLSGRRTTRRNQPPVFMPNWFREHGYFVAEFGKVAHSYGISRERTKWDLEERASIPRVLELLEQPRDEPLFVAIGLTHTHVGFKHTPEKLALYPPERIALPTAPRGFRESHPDAAFTGINVNPERSEDDRRTHTARYYAAISTIDGLVGELLDGVDRLKKRDEFLVVFTSDHGLHLGDRGGIYDKRTLWERSTRVPLVVATPGSDATGETRGLVELVDLFPTLCELCDVPAPPGLEGTSLVPLMNDPDRPWKKAAFSSTSLRGARGRAIRTDRHRYVEWNDGESFLLYDHEHDPGEYVNLANDPEHAETKSRLAALLAAGWKAAAPEGREP